MPKYLIKIVQTIVSFKDIEADTPDNAILIAKKLDLRDQTYNNEICDSWIKDVELLDND